LLRFQCLLACHQLEDVDLAPPIFAIAVGYSRTDPEREKVAEMVPGEGFVMQISKHVNSA
jgi:hypothetical protein